MFSCLPKPGSRNSSIPHCDNTAPLHLLCSFKPCRSVSFTPACSEHKVESDVCRMSSGSPPGFPHHSSLFTTRHSSVKHPVLLTGPFILKQTHSTHNLCSAQLHKDVNWQLRCQQPEIGFDQMVHFPLCFKERNNINVANILYVTL